METDDGLQAYVQKDLDHDDLVNDLEVLHNDLVDIAFAKADIPPTNWNHEWESNFEPIMVNNRCEVRAPFHKAHDVEFDIVIEPKMSFGTGHHQTTHMMMEHLLELELNRSKSA